MKYLCSIIFTFLVFSCQIEAMNNYQGGIRWLNNYDQALQMSQSSSKPILLFFTGSDWCSWCKKLEEEVLYTPEFAQDAGDKFIFVRLDFPLNSSLDPQTTTQNKQLQKKFDIRGFPTIVLLDGRTQQQIGVTGYRPGGGKQYASHLLKMVTDYSNFRAKIDTIEQKKLSGRELRDLYVKANEIGDTDDAEKIIKLGIESSESRFFLTEHYRYLADHGQISSSEAVATRQQLLASDPENESLTHYTVAIIDFETNQENGKQIPPNSAVAPLLTYIEKFGSKDKDHLWRLEMIISQVFFESDDLNHALKYAQEAYEAAPSSAKKEIATAIKNIKISDYKR
jgi:protein disulfide-isomerase